MCSLTGADAQPRRHICPSCEAQFESRNKLYLHLRQSNECVSKPGFNLTVTPATVRSRRQSTALLIGYKGCADDAEKEIEKYLLKSEKPYMFERVFNNTKVSEKVTITRSSGASYRMSPFLQQGDDVAASGDVLTFSYLSKNFQESSNIDLMENTRIWLDNANVALQPKGIHVFSKKTIDSSNVFHAEQHCTVRIYDFVLPVRAILPDNVRNWNSLNSSQRVTIQHRMKRAMRLLTSPVPPDKGGYLWRKSKDQHDLRESGQHRWHNFGTGNLPPNDAAAGRILDRFHVVFEEPVRSLVRTTEEGNQFVLLRLQGDGFVTDQVRRVVGTMICLMRDYLPESFVPFVFDSMNVIDTPIAPQGLTYLKQVRFGFHTHHRSFFANMPTCTIPFDEYTTIDAIQGASYDPIKEVAPSSMYARRLATEMCLSAAASEESIDAWLAETKTLAAMINSKITNILLRREKFKTPIVVDDSSLKSPPNIYQKVLRLLREADKSGYWPTTSAARSKVIDINSTNDSIEKGIEHGGSFSVGKPVQGSTPRGNILFGKLIEAIFELEGLIAPNRDPSSMVAINRRASFKPHVDAGAGYGQSSSLIVGLGDYEGGELAVEGEEFDVRYNPLEFDGWQCRHWTLPFRGERFSLVYFTPATPTTLIKSK